MVYTEELRGHITTLSNSDIYCNSSTEWSITSHICELCARLS